MSSKKKKKKSKDGLGEKLTSGATTAEDNSTLQGMEQAYFITLEDLRIKGDQVLLFLREDLRGDDVIDFTEEFEAELRQLFYPATDPLQHGIDASEEMLEFSMQSQLNLQAFVDRVSNFITRTADVEQAKYYRPLLQLYDSCYRSGLQRLHIIVRRAALVGAKERPHLHAKLMDERDFVSDNNNRLFERFTSQRILWQMDSGRWHELPAKAVLDNKKVLSKSDFNEAHLGKLTAAVKDGNFDLCLNLLDHGQGFVNEQDGKSGATPIHHATWDGRLDIVELLLARGANVNHQTRRGYTALHFAYENHHKDLIKFLSDNDASATVKSLLGQTPQQMEMIRDAKQLRRRRQNLQAAMHAAMAERNKPVKKSPKSKGKKKGKGKSKGKKKKK